MPAIKRTPLFQIRLSRKDLDEFEVLCRLENKNRSQMARALILEAMKHRKHEVSQEAETVLDKRLKKMEDRLAKLMARTLIDVGMLNQVFYKRADKASRDELWEDARKAALVRLQHKRKGGDEDATEIAAIALNRET